MAWHRTGDKSLPEPMLTQITDIYVALGEDELIDSTVSDVIQEWYI